MISLKNRKTKQESERLKKFKRKENNDLWKRKGFNNSKEEKDRKDFIEKRIELNNIGVKDKGKFRNQIITHTMLSLYPGC